MANWKRFLVNNMTWLMADTTLTIGTHHAAKLKCTDLYSETLAILAGAHDARHVLNKFDRQSSTFS